MFFTNSGTEANELALMMAKLYTGYQDIVSIRNGYHGNAVGTMGATGQSTWKFNVVQVLRVVCFLNKDSYLTLCSYICFFFCLLDRLELNTL